MKLSALSILALLGVGQPESNLIRYESGVGAFSVLLSGEPVETKLEEPDRYRILFDGYDGAYLVFHEGRPDLTDESDEVRRQALTQAMRGLEAMVGGRLLEESKQDLEGEPLGLAFDIEMAEPPGLFRSRLYLVGGRLVRLTAVGDLEFTLSERAEAFLASFRALGESDPP